MKFTIFPSRSAAPDLQAAAASAQSSASPGQWYAQGVALADAGAYDRALRCFEEVAILAPEDIETLVYQVVCLIHLGQPQRALTVADRVLAVAPHCAQGHLYRGVALHRLGRYRAAYASYAKV
jgi:tetratricopeptide (TPR) repeat protein